MFSRYFKNGAGFTLLEIIIVISILGTLGTIIYQFVVQGNQMFNQSRDQALAQNTLRKVMDSFAKELRSAQNADTGAYLLVEALEQSIIFYSDIDKDGSRERLHYFLDGIDFKKGVTDPPAPEVITTIVSDIRNTEPIFTYFDENYTGIEPALAQPVNINQVRLVHMKFTADINPLKPPGPISIETSVVIRNLKTNL